MLIRTYVVRVCLYGPVMPVRPSQMWRAEVAEHADAAEHYTANLIAATDASLASFESELGQLTQPSDQQIFSVVERAVLALNGVDEEHGAFGTIEREELCEYIDQALAERGIDVDALAARNSLNPAEITGPWRDW